MSRHLQPARNYRCSHKFNSESKSEILKKCSRSITNINLLSVLGEGGFGVVYKGEGIFEKKEIDLAVKFIGNLNLDKMNDEIEFSYYMGENKLGPKVYDAFFIQDYKNDFNQFILMEPFDIDVHNLLSSSETSIDTKIKLVKKMVKLIEKQNELGLVCFDMKPSNFVYRYIDKEMRIIDFGGNLCEFDDEKAETRILTMYITLLSFLYFYLIQSSDDLVIILPITSNKNFVAEYNKYKLFRRKHNYNKGYEDFVGEHDFDILYTYFKNDDIDYFINSTIPKIHKEAIETSSSH